MYVKNKTDFSYWFLNYIYKDYYFQINVMKYDVCKISS